MKNSFFKIVFIVLSFLTLLTFQTSSISAQFDACDFLPCPSDNQDTDINNPILVDEDPATTVEQLIFWLASFIFVGFLAYGILIIIKASFNIVKSEGEEESIAAAQKSIRSVFIGIVILVIGAIGIIILTSLFQVGSIFDINIQSPRGFGGIPFIN